MGIRGLWTILLKEYQDSIFNFIEVIEYGATLLVDGNSFLFHLLNHQVLSIYKRFSFPRELGGCYSLMKEMIRLEIQRLRQKLGFSNLIFYFDGRISYFKGDTKEKRRKQILEQWNKIYSLSLGKLKASSLHPSDLPLPPLAHVLLRQVLEEMRITIVNCPDEADQIMAIECRKLNSKQSNGKTVAFCYSGDRTTYNCDSHFF